METLELWSCSTHGQVQIGLGSPDRSRPSLHSASLPHGFGEHREPEVPEPTLKPTPAPEPEPEPVLRQVPPVLGSPEVPGGHEHSALCWTPRQLAVGLQQGPPPQNVGPQGSDNTHIYSLVSPLPDLPTNTGGVVAGPAVRAHLVSE